MKKVLRTVGMMAATCAFGGVYDYCDYHHFQLVPPADSTCIIMR